MNTPLCKRQQILISFLLQIRRETDKGVIADLKSEILAMIKRLLDGVQTQQCDQVTQPIDLA